MNRIAARENHLRIFMFYHALQLRSFACLRLAACAVLLACAVLMLASPAAFAQVEVPEEAGLAWDLSKPCENAQHPYQAELCQQWRTAEAAESTTKLTRLLMLVGAVIVGLLLLAFIPLIAGVVAARKGARGGGVVMPEIVMPESSGDRDNEEEIRAYVDVDEVEFIETPESKGIVKVKVTFRNTGQTPAFKVRSAIEIGIRDEADEDLVPVMPLPGRSANSAKPRLGRDATLVDIVDCDSTPKLSDRVMEGDASIVVWGWVEYVDVFDRRQKTAFQYLCNAETLETGQVFKPTTRGDEDD